MAQALKSSILFLVGEVYGVHVTPRRKVACQANPQPYVTALLFSLHSLHKINVMVGETGYKLYLWLFFQSTNEDVGGPNISVATAVAGRYYILQPVGALRESQGNSDENKRKVNDPSHQLTQNLIAQSRLPLLAYTFNSPLVELRK